VIETPPPGEAAVGSGPDWSGACQNFIAATNVAALGTVTFAGTPVSKGFAVAGMASVAAVGVTCAAAMLDLNSWRWIFGGRLLISLAFLPFRVALR